MGQKPHTKERDEVMHISLFSCQQAQYRSQKTFYEFVTVEE
jgi:uncharacterized cupin superfamily protein